MKADKSSLITFCFIAGTLTFIGINLIKESNILNIKEPDIVYTSSLSDTELAKSNKDMSNTRVIIEFSKIDTLEEEYNTLRDKCNMLMEEDNDSEKVETLVDIKDSYADNMYNIINGYSDNMHETGPIYFQDKLLLRYINELGKMQIVASDYNNTYNRNNINTIFKDVNNNVIESESSKDGVLTEEEYIVNIANIFIEAISNDKNSKEFKRRALKYFTYDGYNNIIENSIKTSGDIKVKVAEAGKSDLKLKEKDRIFIQLEIDGKYLSNIVVKLNRNFKVFDIDII